MKLTIDKENIKNVNLGVTYNILKYLDNTKPHHLA